MEARKITIANSREQNKKVIMSAATTLGELKRDLTAEGIDYGDMDFIEALTKTQLRGDDSVLPRDVPYNHTVTNELVFLLTTPNRKIKSGSSRDDIFHVINSMSNSDELKEAIKTKFGRNYTIIPTVDLANFVEEWQRLHKDPADFNPMATVSPDNCKDKFEVLEKKVACLQKAIMEIVDVLTGEGLDTDDICAALNASNEIVYSVGMSSEEIDKLVESVID